MGLFFQNKILLSSLLGLVVTLPSCNNDQELSSNGGNSADRKSGQNSSNSNACLGLVNGSNTSAFPASALIASQASSTSYKICSGAFIAKNAIVTAGHCIVSNDATKIRYLGNTSVPAGKLTDSFSKGEKVKTVVTRGDNYIGSNVDPMNEDSRKNDIAIIIFENDIAPAVLSVASERPSVGSFAVLVGYGLDTFASSAPAGYVYRQQAGNNEVIASSSAVPTSLLTFDSRGAAVNFGDSGGPVIVGDKLAGVASSRVILSNGLNLSLYVDVLSTPAQELILQAISQGARFPSSNSSGNNTSNSNQATPLTNTNNVASNQKSQQIEKVDQAYPCSKP